MNRPDDKQCPKDHYQAQGNGECGPDWPTKFPNPPKPTCCKCNDPPPTTPGPGPLEKLVEANDSASEQLVDEIVQQDNDQKKRAELEGKDDHDLEDDDDGDDGSIKYPG